MKRLLLVALAIVILLPVVVLVGSFVAELTRPAHLSVDFITTRFAAQLVRLRELRDVGTRSQLPRDVEGDWELFAAPGLLEARYQETKAGWSVVSRGSVDFRRGRGFFAREPAEGAPTANRMTYELMDGRTLDVVIYAEVGHDDLGQIRGIELVLDESALQQEYDRLRDESNARDPRGTKADD